MSDRTYVLIGHDTYRYLIWCNRSGMVTSIAHVGSTLDDAVPWTVPLASNHRFISRDEAEMFVLEYRARKALGDGT